MNIDAGLERIKKKKSSKKHSNQNPRLKDAWKKGLGSAPVVAVYFYIKLLIEREMIGLENSWL